MEDHETRPSTGDERGRRRAVRRTPGELVGHAQGQREPQTIGRGERGRRTEAPTYLYVGNPACVRTRRPCVSRRASESPGGPCTSHPPSGSPWTAVHLHDIAPPPLTVAAAPPTRRPSGVRHGVRMHRGAGPADVNLLHLLAAPVVGHGAAAAAAATGHGSPVHLGSSPRGRHVAASGSTRSPGSGRRAPRGTRRRPAQVRAAYDPSSRRGGASTRPSTWNCRARPAGAAAHERSDLG
jgi:hypothetical protein